MNDNKLLPPGRELDALLHAELTHTINWSDLKFGEAVTDAAQNEREPSTEAA